VNHGRGEGLVLSSCHSSTGLILGGCLGVGHSFFLFTVSYWFVTARSRFDPLCTGILVLLSF
jgi:hypothetical protein